MRNIAVFIDRDGTLIEDVGYISSIDALSVIDGSADAIRRLNKAGIKVVIITNQAGIARGFFDEDTLITIHERLIEILSEHNAVIDKIYYCPHYPEGTVPEYSISCLCRKPEPGMVEKAVEELGIDLKRSYIVGDKASDIELAQRIGARGILVLTGYGSNVVKDNEVNPTYIAPSLKEAVEWILMTVNNKL